MKGLADLFKEEATQKMNQEKNVFRQINSVSALKAVWNVSVLGLWLRILGVSQVLYMEFCHNCENDFLPWIV